MIDAEEVRLIGPDGEQFGIVKLAEAMSKSDDFEQDLVEIAPNAKPPVVKIMDYGKYKYEQSKREKEARKKQHHVELKEIRLRPRTDVHDLEIKINKAREFIEGKDKVKFTIMFRGREMAYKEFGYDLMDRVVEKMEDVAKVESPVKMEGRNMHLIMCIK